jgi:hypothetical protein
MLNSLHFTELPCPHPKGFTLQPDLLFLHRQKKVGKKTLVRKMLPPTSLRSPRFSDRLARLFVYNQLIFNCLLLKLTTLGILPVNRRDSCLTVQVTRYYFFVCP